MIRPSIATASLVVLVQALVEHAAAGSVELVVKLNGAAAKQLFVAGQCNELAPVLLKGEQLIGRSIPVTGRRTVTTADGEVDMVEIALGGKPYCVAKDDVLLSTDPAVQLPATNRLAAGGRPVTASRGLGEGQE